MPGLTAEERMPTSSRPRKRPATSPTVKRGRKAEGSSRWSTAKTPSRKRGAWQKKRKTIGPSLDGQPQGHASPHRLTKASARRSQGMHPMVGGQSKSCAGRQAAAEAGAPLCGAHGEGVGKKSRNRRENRSATRMCENRQKKRSIWGRCKPKSGGWWVVRPVQHRDRDG